ncbi:MAG: hypothetical protein V4724_26660 [Pseudomonadota bacterium]
MRISADSKSPWFSSLALCATVYLDGEELRHCVTADEDCGEVECFQLDKHGNLIHDGENVQLITKRGWVSVIYPGMDFDAWMRARAERVDMEYRYRLNQLHWIDAHIRRTAKKPLELNIEGIK